MSHQYLWCPCIDRTRKQTLLTKWFNFGITKDLLLISQSNVQPVKAEKEEWYTLSNIIYIKLQNYCFFSLRSTLKLLKYTNQLPKQYLWRSSFFCLLFYQRYASLQVFFKIFAQVCSVVIYKEMFECLRTSVSQKSF